MSKENKLWTRTICVSNWEKALRVLWTVQNQHVLCTSICCFEQNDKFANANGKTEVTFQMTNICLWSKLWQSTWCYFSILMQVSPSSPCVSGPIWLQKKIGNMEAMELKTRRLQPLERGIGWNRPLLFLFKHCILEFWSLPS